VFSAIEIIASFLRLSGREQTGLSPRVKRCFLPQPPNFSLGFLSASASSRLFIVSAFTQFLCNTFLIHSTFELTDGTFNVVVVNPHCHAFFIQMEIVHTSSQCIMCTQRNYVTATPIYYAAHVLACQKIPWKQNVD